IGHLTFSLENVKALVTSIMKGNLTVECGSEDLRLWDRHTNDFGQCFFHLFVQLPVSFVFYILNYLEFAINTDRVVIPVFGMLAIISAFYMGKRQVTYSFFGAWNTCQSGLIYSRSVIVSLLALISLSQMMIHCAVFRHHVNFVDASVVSVKTFSWVLHLIYILLLKRGNSFNTRGPKLAMLAWFLAAIVSVFELRSKYLSWLTDTDSSSTIPNIRNSYYEYRHHHHLSYVQNLDDILRDKFLWLWTSGFEVLLHGLYLLTLIPGSTHLEQRHYRHRTRANDIVYNAYESQENNSFVGFDEEDENEELPLGVAKESSGIVSKLLFLWVNPLIRKGACGYLTSCESLFDLPHTISTGIVAAEFQKLAVSRRLSLLKALHIRFGLEFYSIGILKLISDGAGFCGPILLSCLVRFIEDTEEDVSKESIWQGYSYVGGMFAAVFIGALSNSHFNMKMAEVNLKIRAALITTIYRKTVQLQKMTLENFSSGEIINFMSTDTDRIVNFCPSFHAFWSLPVQVAVTLYLLYQQIGVAFLAGVVFAILLIPINRYLANKIGDLSTKMMHFKDQRVKLMSEILYGIRVLKFHAWEAFFVGKVNEIREKEIKNLKGRKYLDALCVYFWATTPVLVSLFSFGTYILLGNQLTAAKVFTSIALFNMLISPLNALPWVLNGVVEAWVSVKRISKLLQVEDTDLSKIYSPVPRELQKEYEILVNDGQFSWGDGKAGIENVNLNVKKGQFIGVIGEVGSGKSSLLLALLGELGKSAGSLSFQSVGQGVGLVLQEAWIQRGTIRSNICFAPNTNFTRYKSVIESCCLNDDLDAWKTRDDTPVGDSGVTLSGGQRIRLTLARAVYQNYNVYFLDDIFSAVDYKVAHHLYNKCVMGTLREKTRIVCTHHVRFLQHADWILVMDNGKVISQGLPKDILPKYLESSDLGDSIEQEAVAVTSGSSSKKPNSLLGFGEELDSSSVMNASSLSFELKNEETGKSSDFNKEHQKEGTIRLHIYHSYYRAVGRGICWLILISLTAMQASRNLSDLWLAHWVHETATNPNSTVPNTSTTPVPMPTFETPTGDTSPYVSGEDANIYDDDDNNNDAAMDDNSIEGRRFGLLFASVLSKLPFMNGLDPAVKYYFSILIAIGVANSVFTLARAFLFAFGGIRGALKIHNSLLTSVLKAKMSFFDSNSIGRIINRFSSDVATVDDSLPFISNILFAQTFGLIGTLVVTCYALPWIIAIVIPLLLVCNNIQEYYRHTARQLRRLGSVSLSPVYAHFSETLKGLVTIRAMKAVRRFEEMNEAFLESSQKCQYSTQAVSQWLSFRLQMVGLIVISGVGLLGILQHHFGTADPGIIGLAISYALTVTNSLSGFVTFFTETEKEMVAVERACEYIEEIEEEKQTETRISLPYLWPAQGVIHFRSVFLKYRPDQPYVLNNVTFETRPAEKIGVCGRTGSGKSSLFTALFRMLDSFDGDITIDTVNIKHLSLKDLRTRLCIIPQDPLIFSGSLRENLDPKGDYCDDDLQRAVDKCQLTSLVDKLGGLDGTVGESGNQLSTGFKQLVCLARAVLINAKVLCIDEATANVDQDTDKIIQATLRTSFSQSTVITVAHRVNTVLHCDRVLVMSGGEIVEFEDPGLLMQKQDSKFYKLAHGLA
ncbi:Multidrug resistance-associated protein 7, partial [Orchesella cincta]